MKQFLTEAKSSRGSQLSFRVKKQYIEIESPYPENADCSYFLYLVPLGEGQALLATCWDQAWDDVPAEVIASHLPTLHRTLQNARQDRTGKNQMIYAADPKDGVNKWLMVRQIPFDLDAESPFEDPAFLDGLGKIFEKSRSLVHEMLALHQAVNNNGLAPKGVGRAAREESSGMGIAGKALLTIAAGLFFGVDLGFND